MEYRIAGLKLLGSKGTTGTQASFMELFEGDTAKIKEVDRLICEEMGFDGVVPVLSLIHIYIPRYRRA